MAMKTNGDTLRTTKAMWLIPVLLSFALLASPAMATLAITETGACGGQSLHYVIGGLGAKALANLTYDSAIATELSFSACTVGTYVNGTHIIANATGYATCTGSVADRSNYGTHTIGVEDNATSGVLSDTLAGNCFGVTDLVSQGVDIAGKFMYELVQQSGNVAALIILGLMITLILGLLGALGAIFYVFKFK